MKVKKKMLLAPAIAAGLFGTASVSHADSVSFTGTGTFNTANDLAAEVDFNLTGSTLTVTLTNTSTVAAADFANYGDLLTGVYWNSSQSIGGTLSTVEINTGSSEVGSSDPAALGWFSYDSGLTPKINNATYGATSAGFFSNDPLVAIGGNPGTPKSPDGPAGGLIPIANAGTYDGKDAVIADSVVYTITGVNITSLFTSGNPIINGVVFQYGTGNGEPTFGGNRFTSPPPPPPPVSTPLPLTATSGLFLLAGGAAVGLLRKRGQGALQAE